MLVGINLSGASSDDVPQDWGDKQRAIAIVAEVIEKYGLEAPILEQYRSPMTDAEIAEGYGSAIPAQQASVNATSMGPNGQWFNVMMFDSSKDVDGRLAERGFGADNITLYYGANALLPEADRAEFVQRLKSFEGFALPEPIED